MKLEQTFQAVETAAIAGQRCPQNSPFGPLVPVNLAELIRLGFIRSEVFAKNWRVITILEGPHRGKATAAPPWGGRPYLVNGIPVGGVQRRHQRKIAP